MKRYLRLYQILTLIQAYRLTPLLPKHYYCRWLKILLGCLFWVRPKAKDRPLGERLRLAFEELGPVWIKFGQMLSTRRDLLPPEVAAHLALLHDQVKPFDGQQAKQIIEQALGAPITEYFSEFELEPMASASIAQVHGAVLKKSQIPVIIKVLRPGLEEVIAADISVIYLLAEKISGWIKGGERLRAYEVVRDYEHTLYQELDLQREAYNTLRLRENFIDSDFLYIPYVYTDLCRKNILVEERVHGAAINDIEALKAAGVNLKLLAERGVQAFFTQVFRDNFFHADMHPGNIFVDITDPQDPRYIGIDCAIIGELKEEDQQYLAENFIAFFNRDYRRIAELYLDSGWIAPDTNIYEFEAAMREVCEPIFAKPLGEISFAQLLFNLFNVARRFHMEVQPQLVLLEKTLFYVEGLGRQLYPQLDLWTTAKPFLEDWYQEQISLKSLAKQLQRDLPAWRKLLPKLPFKLENSERRQRLHKSRLDNLTLQLYTVEQRLKRQNYLLAAITLIAIVLLFIAL